MVVCDLSVQYSGLHFLASERSATVSMLSASQQVDQLCSCKEKKNTR